MSYHSAQHASDTLLEAFLVGDLEESLLVAIATHVDHCPACSGRLSALDPLESLFIEIPTPRVPVDLVERVLAAAQSSHESVEVFSSIDLVSKDDEEYLLLTPQFAMAIGTILIVMAGCLSWWGNTIPDVSRWVHFIGSRIQISETTRLLGPALVVGLLGGAALIVLRTRPVFGNLPEAR